MKFIGRINLTKQELLDIIFKRESVSIDPQISDRFSKDKKPCILDYQKVIEMIEEQQKITQNVANLAKCQSFGNDHLFLRGFLVVLLLQVVAKKGAFRLEFAQFLVKLINSEIAFKQLDLAKNPWNVVNLFYKEAEVSQKVSEIEEISAFVGISESEKQVIFNTMEKIYVFALSMRLLDTMQKQINLQILSFAFYCERGHINTDFLQIFEKKQLFQRNVSIVASILQNLLQNSNLKKMSPSSFDTTWIELCGQTKYSINCLINFIVEELNVEDIEGLKLNDTRLERTQQTLHSLSLQIVGNLLVQIENILIRQNQIQIGQEEDEMGLFLTVQLEQVQQQCAKLVQTLNYQSPQSQEFGEQTPQVFSFSEVINLMTKASEIEIFSSLFNLHSKYLQLNPVKPQQVEEQDKNQQVTEGQENKKMKQGKDGKAGKKKEKKIGFGLGTAVIFEYFQQLVDFEAKGQPQNNLNLLQTKFFNDKNVDLLQMFEEMTVSKNSERRKVKTAKGTQDFGGKEMALRRNIFNTVTSVFRSRGAVEIDTPVFELKETLTGKYGEDSKLIYDLEDQGGELLSLRYDLTVPFARYMAQQNLKTIKRYQVQKVYRRDQPNIKRGRFREFYQCDFDISGKGDSMLQDAEVISVFNEILTKLSLDKYIIKINNRQILDAMIEISGAPMNKFKPICSAIDKLDKEEWSTVYKELVEDKGIDAKAVEKIGSFVNGLYTGNPFEVLKALQDNKAFEGSQKGDSALKEMEQLFVYLKSLNSLDNVSFDLSLARGLDYYTGVIFEIVLIGEQVGSIAGGGRYDELIGMFMDKKDAVPSVGGSLGIERVYRILEAKKLMKKFTETEVLVCTIGSFADEKLQICSELWNRGIKAEYLYKVKDKSQRQLEYAIYNNIPFAIFVGEDEVINKKVTVKNMYLKTQEQVGRDEYLDLLQKWIAQYYEDVEKGGIVQYYEESQNQQQQQEEEQQGDKKGKKGGEGKQQKDKQPAEKKPKQEKSKKEPTEEQKSTQQ